jgi:hypothetical protein
VPVGQRRIRNACSHTETLVTRPLCTPVHAVGTHTPLLLRKGRAQTSRTTKCDPALTWRRRPAVTSREEGTCLRGTVHYAWARPPETLSHYSDPPRLRLPTWGRPPSSSGMGSAIWGPRRGPAARSRGAVYRTPEFGPERGLWPMAVTGVFRLGARPSPRLTPVPRINELFLILAVTLPGGSTGSR